MSPGKKTKLRTAGDVISRLKWADSSDNPAELIFMGYMDRIEGPMEKNVEDYVSAGNGGDIPEHRILYFRRSNGTITSQQQILWDRVGRVDRIFGSGDGRDAPVAPATIDVVRVAIANMRRIEQEKEARRAEKAKQRARRARNRVTKRCEASKTIEAEESRTADPQNHRFQWTTSPWLVYSPEREEWAPGSFEQELLEQQVKIGSTNTSQDLVAVSYNVLFDKFDDGLKSDDHTKTPASMVKASAQRWRQLISVLESTDSDLISLQEATPSFIKVLCGTAWVQESYACSASPTSSKTVDPSGVLLLWRRSTMLPVSQELSLFRCSDFGRNRSIAAALRPRSNRTNTVLFAATHLPADRAAVAGSRATDKDCRRLARKRELAAILGEFGRLQSRILELPSAKRERISVTPLVAGDFNSQDDELLDGLFAGHNENRKRGLFRDVWQFAGRGPGWTWDPSRNPRAARSSGLVGGKHNARRIDRVFVGPCVSASSQGSATILEPRFAELVGQASGQEIPPSDHFGVRCAFHTLPKKSMDIVRGSAHSFWAARTPSSPHYMLSLVLDNPRLERLKTENNPESSLPLLHLTLLHGFVEADAGCLDLAKSCVERAIRAASSSSPTPENLFFSWETGLGIFEHRDSTTIVGSPDKGKGGTNWVENLYRALRGIFLQCDEQERHSEAGWQPHVTLGVAGSSAAAREIQAGWLRDGSWNNVVEKMAILSVDIFRRGASGKFHSIACFPIISGYNSPTTIDSFLRDAGAATSMEEQQKAAVIVSRIERACRTVTRSSPIDARVQVGGSSKLAAALPGLSDVDAAVLLTPADESSDALWRVREASRGTKFLQSIFESVKEEMPVAQGKFRPGGQKKSILTIRVPGLPSIDLTLCASDAKGAAICIESQECMDCLQDSDVILQALCAAGGPQLVELFQGALRIIKFWAHRNHIYGASTGFIGGGGWAVWLGKCVLDATDAGLLEHGGPRGSKTEWLVRYFFTQASKHSCDESIELRPTARSTFLAVRQKLHPGNLVILAPCSKGNFARSTTQSTSAVILNEAKAALQRLSRSSSMHGLLQWKSAADFISEFPRVLALEIYRTDKASAKPAEIKAWGSRHFLQSLIYLEKKAANVAGILRPKSAPLRIRKEWQVDDADATGFAWIIGVSSVERAVLSEIERLNQILLLSLEQRELGAVQGRFHALTTNEALDRVTPEDRPRKASP